MPSALLESRALGTKLITVYSRNRECALLTLYASYLLLELDTGAPLALDGGRIPTTSTRSNVSTAAKGTNP